MPMAAATARFRESMRLLEAHGLAHARKLPGQAAALVAENQGIALWHGLRQGLGQGTGTIQHKGIQGMRRIVRPVPGKIIIDP